MEPLQPLSQQSLKPPVVELPHLVVDEPKRSKAGVLAVVVLSLLLLGLPVGIFLVSQRTQLSPQAAVTQVVNEAGAGVVLESKLSSESRGGLIPVDVYVKSPIDAVNLVDAQINFDPGLVEIEKIATDAASLNIQPVFTKWIEANFDNKSGKISIISGMPTPGAKTGGANEDKVYLATLFLKSKGEGATVLEVSPDSQILRNTDNENVFKIGNDLALNLTNPIQESLVSPAPSASPKKQSQEEEALPLVVITSPVTAANYSYFRPMSIVWSSFNTKIISSINIYVNGQLLGPVVQNLEAETGTFEWRLQDTLALHYVQPANVFEIEVVGVSGDGKVAKALTGPFGILGSEQVSNTPPNMQAFAQNQLSIEDVSRALSNYLTSPLKDASLDLNKDGVINELDLFLIRQNLLLRGIIK